MRKAFLLLLLIFMGGCSQQTSKPALLPQDEFLVIAHRGASAYAPAHTLAAYELAVKMEADYIELDLHRTKDGKLVALHDAVLTFADAEQAVSDVTFNELELYLPGEIFNKNHPAYASPAFEDLQVVDLEEILHHFKDTTNYYIELKLPDSYPGIEKELLKQLRDHDLLDREDAIPKVIIQSFDSDILRKVFELEPSIPLIQLLTFEKEAALSKKKIKKVRSYASGIGLNADSVTPEFIDAMHEAGLHVHPYTVNEPKAIYSMNMLGADGIFTDKPDVANHLKKQINEMEAE